MRLEPYSPFLRYSQNYLYISLDTNRVEVGNTLNIKAHIKTSTPENRVLVEQLTYVVSMGLGRSFGKNTVNSELTALFLQVLSKGKIIQGGRLNVKGQDTTNIPLLITTEMLPAFRFVAYYMLPWKFRAEVVSDSVLVDVEDRCVGSVSPFSEYTDFPQSWKT